MKVLTVRINQIQNAIGIDRFRSGENGHFEFPPNLFQEIFQLRSQPSMYGKGRTLMRDIKSMTWGIVKGRFVYRGMQKCFVHVQQ
mmetsp:Transcript_102565/g.287461  ORF Transcript_102565/g.287461 Transcript_102565/m.287461 type:complete len:85 (-) Transcript_102565:487-741(-)